MASKIVGVSEPSRQLWVQCALVKRDPSMKKPILLLLLAWIVIYAGNHLLFRTVAKNNEIGMALRSQASSETQEIDSWGPYLPGAQAKDPHKPDATSMKALAPSQTADANLRSDSRAAENLGISDSSGVEPSPVKIPPTPTRKPDVVSSISSSTNPRIQAPNVVGVQNKKMVAEQKNRRVARATNPRHNIPRSGRNMPEEAWSPSPPPYPPRFAENRPEGFPSMPPRRWHSGMFMFAPPDF